MMILNPEVKKTLRSLIDEHLRERGWNLTNFSEIKKEYPTPTGRLVDYMNIKAI